jgi:hypothetical protein
MSSHCNIKLNNRRSKNTKCEFIKKPNYFRLHKNPRRNGQHHHQLYRPRRNSWSRIFFFNLHHSSKVSVPNSSSNWRCHSRKKSSNLWRLWQQMLSLREWQLDFLSQHDAVQSLWSSYLLSLPQGNSRAFRYRGIWVSIGTNDRYLFSKPYMSLVKNLGGRVGVKEKF